MREWYLSHAGKKTGPMRAKQIAKLVAGGAFRPNDALVWKEGMDVWKSIKDSGVLSEASLQPEIEPAQSLESVSGSGSIRGAAMVQQHMSTPARDEMVDSPYSVPLSPLETVKSQEVDYGGVGRLVLFLAPLILSLICYIVLMLVYEVSFYQAALVDPSGDYSWISGGVIAAYIGLTISVLWFHAARFRNLGMSGWWVLGLLVPFLNIWLSWRQYTCPPGYAYHHELDTIGKILTFVFVIIPLVFVIILLLGSGAYGLF